MKKILSVIFILIILFAFVSCGRPENRTTDIAKEEFAKIGIDNPEIACSAFCGFSDKALGVYLAEYDDERMCIALEFNVNGENNYSYSETLTPKEIYERIYTLSWQDRSVLFVANESCATVIVDCGDDGNRVDDIRKSSYPYLTVEEGERTFLCYDGDMKEMGK